MNSIIRVNLGLLCKYAITVRNAINYKNTTNTCEILSLTQKIFQHYSVDPCGAYINGSYIILSYILCEFQIDSGIH